ncbi:MAG TPA: preprotein translocase subunit SecE [Firmicutes bacterium]|jgi:preprotein translocase, secE subunit|nr:preprotein translocase subunit SecE [Bacillota bacterium]
MSKKEKDLQEETKAPEKKTEAPRKNPKQDKNKKPNIFVRMGRKIKETFSELKRVTWPTFGKALKATGVVLVIVLIFTVIVTGINYGLSELLDLMVSTGA